MDAIADGRLDALTALDDDSVGSLAGRTARDERSI
jgi:hypothetical protein